MMLLASTVLVLASCGDSGDDGGGEICGNGVCGVGENASNCSTDCGGGSGVVCGDGQCEAGESAATCSEDCGGGGPNPSGLATNFCKALCSDPGCAGDFDYYESFECEQDWETCYPDCVSDCTEKAANCSDSILDAAKDCMGTYPCDGENSWIYCLDEIEGGIGCWY